MITSMTTTASLTSAPSSSSLFLTPRKKTATPTDVQPAASASTLGAIYQWCVVNVEEATVLCFVRDIHAMTQDMFKGKLYGLLKYSLINYSDGNLFWIGKVPCIRVKFVGMVVGVQDTGKRVKITGKLTAVARQLSLTSFHAVDDGTAVIDCVTSSMVPPTPASPSSSSKSTSLPASSTTIRIGHLVRVIGKVEGRHETREIKFDSVGASVRKPHTHARGVTSL